LKRKYIEEEHVKGFQKSRNVLPSMNSISKGAASVAEE
jgi:hypothetical protein